LNEQDSNIDTGENKNKEVVNKHNNFDSQHHNNDGEITRLNDFIIKNIYDPSEKKNNIDTKLRYLVVENVFLK